MKNCINKRCHKELQDDFIFCPYCGKAQSEEKKKKSQKRANGTGSIYYRKDNKTNPYTAASTITGKRVYLGSFPTRTLAARALQEYEYNPVSAYNITLAQLHDKWLNSKSYKKLAKNTQSGYSSAWNKLKPLHQRKVRDIRTSDLQQIVDYYENPHHEVGAGGKLKYIDKKGKATFKETDKPKICEGLKYSALHNLKVLMTILFNFAMQDDIVNKNYASFVELPAQEEINATRFTDLQLAKIKNNINKIEWLDYVYALCYLNFRVSEFLELTKDDYYVTDTGVHYLMGGKKTAAGKNRVVPIHPQIQKIVDNCIAKNGETIFCRNDGTAMNKDYFREYCFYPAMDKIGFGRSYTPHSCRRTFSTRMSAAGARQEDIIALMGHTNFEVDQKHYIKQEIETLFAAVIKMA